jgi:hypothetical protein
MRPPPEISTDRALFDEGPKLASPDARAVKSYECDACGRPFQGEPAGSGLFIWSRGDEVRYEEPPLCEECANKITLGALLAFDTEEEEEG